MALAGKRILVVEDEALLALALEATLRRQGCHVVGPVPRLAAAHALVEREPIDGAVLDVNLDGTPVFPLALRLKERNIPFVFATGWAGSALCPPAVRDATQVHKPYSDGQIVTALERALAGSHH